MIASASSPRRDQLLGRVPGKKGARGRRLELSRGDGPGRRGEPTAAAAESPETSSR